MQTLSKLVHILVADNIWFDCKYIFFQHDVTWKQRDIAKGEKGVLELQSVRLKKSRESQ